MTRTATDPHGMEVFAGYTLQTRLGVGGMGEVFRACKARHGVEHFVALKRILEDAIESPEHLHYFLREMNTAAQLQHTNIVRMLNFGQDEASKRYYLVLELVEGYDLRALSRRLAKLAKKTGPRYPGQERGLLPAAVVAYVGLGIARGLGYAHSQKEFAGGEGGVIHRDVSPDNIMLDVYGVPKLSDFGVAKPIGHDADSRTRTGEFRGKVRYASPEQCCGKPLDATTDLYALAVVLFELLTGKHPYDDPVHPHEMMEGKVYRATQKQRETIAQLAPNMPPAMQEILEEILQPDPRARPQSAADLIEPLKLATLQALGSRPDGRPFDLDDAQRWSVRLVRSVYAARTNVEMQAIRPEDLEETSSPKSHKRLVGQGGTEPGQAEPGPISDVSTASPPTAPRQLTAPMSLATAPLDAASVAPIAAPAQAPESSRTRTLLVALAISTLVLLALIAGLAGFVFGGAPDGEHAQHNADVAAPSVAPDPVAPAPPSTANTDELAAPASQGPTEPAPRATTTRLEPAPLETSPDTVTAEPTAEPSPTPRTRPAPRPSTRRQQPTVPQARPLGRPTPRPMGLPVPDQGGRSSGSGSFGL